MQKDIAAHQNLGVPKSGGNTSRNDDGPIAIKPDESGGLIKIAIVDKIGMQPYLGIVLHRKIATIVQPALGQGKRDGKKDGYVEEGFQNYGIKSVTVKNHSASMGFESNVGVPGVVMLSINVSEIVTSNPLGF